ncbi:MAG: type III secretion system chaperone [Chthoniobacterales bacterium]|nr:type III secretion system chaperone [Chthoniobacterales bacterium]
MPSPYLFLLEALRVHCKLPPFPDPIPSNQLTLQLEDGPAVSVDFNEEASMILLFSEIGIYTEEKEREVLADIAEANFLWAATNGATLSARPEIQTVYLAQQMSISVLDGQEFIALVEKFVATTQQWQTILSKKEQEKGAQATEDQEATASSVMIDKA